MGWKASAVLVNERDPGYFATAPRHDPVRARELGERLGMFPRRGVRSIGTFALWEEIYPAERSRVAVGAYDGAAAFVSQQLIGCTNRTPTPRLQRILAEFPAASVLAIELHSVVNLFGYAWYDRGLLRRAYGGDADSGVTVDVGELLPAERPYFERSIIRGGERLFLSEATGTVEEVDAAAFGEELVFAVSATFLGFRFDEDGVIEPQVKVFKSPWWARFI